MAKHYVTFGQVHKHIVNGHTLDKDCVACFEAVDSMDGRFKAFEFFDDKFFTDYHEDEFNMNHLVYFPRGIIVID